MCASTNASSVIEWDRRYDHQRAPKCANTIDIAAIAHQTACRTTLGTSDVGDGAAAAGAAGEGDVGGAGDVAAAGGDASESAVGGTSDIADAMVFLRSHVSCTQSGN